MAILSDLHYDLLVNIARRLKKLEDFTSFRSVSKSLRASAKEEYFEGLRLRQRTPYLMLSVSDDGDDDDVREFYSLVEGEAIVASVKVPEFRTKKCLESLGWLLVSEVDGSMSLLDPFSCTEIPLPHRNTFPGYESVGMEGHIFIQKMVLSSRPSETSDFVLMVIGGGRMELAFWRLGDKAWNNFLGSSTRELVDYRDVVYHGDGQFYAFGNPATVRIFNLAGNDESHVVTFFTPGGLTRNYKRWFWQEIVDTRKYILKTVNDSLLIITRTVRDLSSDDLSYITTKFHVYEIDIATSTWKEIHSLGNMAIFLGHNSTISMDASGVIKANHIYFTDDDWTFHYSEEEAKCGGGMDNGVYNFETGTIEPVYPGEVLLNKVSSSTWITPCF